MERISAYDAALLPHLEMLYRPGERQAGRGARLRINDTGFSGGSDETFLAVHSNPDDHDLQLNAFYMSPMQPNSWRWSSSYSASPLGRRDFAALMEAPPLYGSLWRSTGTRRNIALPGRR